MSCGRRARQRHSSGSNTGSDQHVRIPFRFQQLAVSAESRPILLLRQPRPQQCLVVSEVRLAPGRRFHRRDRRNRRRQDNPRANLARRLGPHQGGSGAGGEHAASVERLVACDPDGVRRCIEQDVQGPSDRESRSLLDRIGREGPARPADHRRSAKPQPRSGRGIANVVELPARQPRPAAEFSRRPARVARLAAIQIDGATAPAGHRVVPSRATRQGRNPGLRRAPPAPGRLEGHFAAIRGRCSGPHPSLDGRRPAQNQSAVQSTVARRLPLERQASVHRHGRRDGARTQE